VFQRLKWATVNPISLNPCSFKAVKIVLETLKNELDIPEKWQWSIIRCDALPYLLSSRLIQDNENL
jgi:hypothetical protein